jgi:hypothetical protein
MSARSFQDEKQKRACVETIFRYGLHLSNLVILAVIGIIIIIIIIIIICITYNKNTAPTDIQSVKIKDTGSFTQVMLLAITH